MQCTAQEQGILLIRHISGLRLKSKSKDVGLNSFQNSKYIGKWQLKCYTNPVVLFHTTNPYEKPLHKCSTLAVKKIQNIVPLFLLTTLSLSLSPFIYIYINDVDSVKNNSGVNTELLEWGLL